MQPSAWNEAMFITIMIPIAVSTVDTLSKMIRLRVIGTNANQK